MGINNHTQQLKLQNKYWKLQNRKGGGISLVMSSEYFIKTKQKHNLWQFWTCSLVIKEQGLHTNWHLSSTTRYATRNHKQCFHHRIHWISNRSHLKTQQYTHSRGLQHSHQWPRGCRLMSQSHATSRFTNTQSGPHPLSHCDKTSTTSLNTDLECRNPCLGWILCIPNLCSGKLC